MRRAERRRRNQKVVERRAKIRRRVTSWSAWSVPSDTDKPGKFRKRSPLGCNCSNHNGMCHARKGGDTARVDRRNERQFISEQLGEP